ncbi:MAG: fibronectin type III domain-containing protein [Spirochaetota bacterium]
MIHKAHTLKPYSSLLLYIPAAALLCGVLLFSACAVTGPERALLVLDVSSSSAEPLTLHPDVDMTPARYDFDGKGPGGATFTLTDAQTPAMVSNLAPGDWIVSVNAKNAEGTVIGYGSAEATLAAEGSQQLTVTVYPVDGYGSLDITVYWNAEQTGMPSVEGQLTLGSGSSIPLVFSIDEHGTATCFLDQVPTGYHTLTVNLLDGGTVVMGAVEIARIVDGQVTSGTYEFYDINTAYGEVIIDISPDMQDPLTVTLSGEQDFISYGGSMTVTASVPPEDGTCTFLWYLNGQYRHAGATYTLGSDLPLGYYRLDVTAFSADGSRAGSTTHSLEVIDGETTEVTLAWDPNPEPDIDCYYLHYGTSSGNYEATVNAGDTTTYSVSGLQPGATYYFAVTACNTTGLESGYSNEVTHTVPAL